MCLCVLTFNSMKMVIFSFLRVCLFLLFAFAGEFPLNEMRSKCETKDKSGQKMTMYSTNLDVSVVLDGLIHDDDGWLAGWLDAAVAMIK